MDCIFVLVCPAAVMNGLAVPQSCLSETAVLNLFESISHFGWSPSCHSPLDFFNSIFKRRRTVFVGHNF